MGLVKKFIKFAFQRSTLAILGAILIHVTLGTVYTLSNVNSYLTSYMRLHGTPQATYGGSMWLSASYALGQGVFMILGGHLERRFSAWHSCVLGCLLHSGSIMCTSLSIKHGQLAVLLTYGLVPGAGAGLAYMTPMSNGFGWLPDRKGLVAGLILGGFGLGTFVFNIAQTAYVNPDNLSPSAGSGGYFTQDSILERVPSMFLFMGAIYACLQFLGCMLMFKPPACSEPIEEPLAREIIDNDEDEKKRPSSEDRAHRSALVAAKGNERRQQQQQQQQKQQRTTTGDVERQQGGDEATKRAKRLHKLTFRQAICTRQFIVLFVVYGLTNQGVLFVNAMLKEYAQIFISDDMFLAWAGSANSLANSLGRLLWGLAIDKFSFTQCLTVSTLVFGALMFMLPFEFILSSKALYLLCTLGIFGSFSGWKSTYPVHLSRVFGLQLSGMIYGSIYISQTIGGMITAFGARYLIDNFSRFVPFFAVVIMELLGLCVYYVFYR